MKIKKLKKIKFIPIFLAVFFVITTFNSAESFSYEIIITDTTCSYFDENKLNQVNELAIVKTRHFEDRFHLICMFEIPNDSSKTVIYTANHNPSGEQIACQYNTYQTYDWVEYVNSNGMVIIECIFEK